MLDQVRYIQRDGQSVDIAIVRQRFFETALDARRRSRQGVRHLERRGISGISMRGRLSRSCAISKSSRLRPGLDFANELIKRSLLSVALALALFSSSALAAGVDSRVYTCDGLHALLGANRFVFINYPTFMEFVVDNGSYCSAGEMIGLRSAPTRLPKRAQNCAEHSDARSIVRSCRDCLCRAMSS
jgi:hypothetical protein